MDENTQPADLEQPKQRDKEADKKLVEHCQSLYQAAKSKEQLDRLAMWNDYYIGKFKNNKNQNIQNNFNQIKPIIETIVTLTLDQNITTSVSPKISSFSNLQKIDEIYDIADILNESLLHINRVNNMQEIGKKVLRRSKIMGIGIAKIVWDPDASNGMGDVSIKEVDPRKFFPDPGGKTIKECNYITLETPYSSIELKSKYPDRIDDIDKLIKSNTDKNSKSNTSTSSAIITYKTDQSAVAQYAGNTLNIENLKEDILVYECYLLDDSTFIPSSSDSQAEKQDKAKESLRFMYPNGRVIVYAGNDTVFEDKPIDAPFGFPFEELRDVETDDFWSQGEVEPLAAAQDRLNLAYLRIRTLIAKFVSIILVDEGSGMLSEGELINCFVKELEPGILGSGRQPQVLTNNTISEVKNLLEYCKILKQEMKDLARVNDMMITGERPTGVNSGQMVQDLNESPITSIRESQKSYNQFLVNVSNKAIKLAQLYYKAPRMIRMAEGKDFAYFSTNGGIQTGSIVDQQQSSPNGGDPITKKVASEVAMIQSDLSITDYECEITSGADLPRNRTAYANLMMSLAEKGLLGDIKDIDTIRTLLKALDVPDWRAIYEQLKEKQDAVSNQKPPLPAMDKVNASFKDLPPVFQNAYLDEFGIQKPLPMAPPLPAATPNPLPNVPQPVPA